MIFKLKQNGIEGQLLNLLANYLSNRKQRVLFDGCNSDYHGIQSGVPQGSVLGPLLFLVFINDLEKDIKSKVKFFADDTMLFDIVKDPYLTARDLNLDLVNIQNWAYQWKMSFNPDPKKQAVEMLFSHKRKIRPYFNGTLVCRVEQHKQLGLILDTKLTFAEHINEKILKAYKIIGTLRYLSCYLLLKPLDQIYKMMIHPHLDYCDVIYHIPQTRPYSTTYFFSLNSLMENKLKR